MKILLYGIMGMGVVCLLVKLCVSSMYGKLIRAAEKMGKSNHPLMKLLINKFETCYKLKMGVENVEIFVDKYLNCYKVMGIRLSGWEVWGDVLFGVTLLVSMLANLYITIVGYGKEVMMQYILVGIVICGVILLEDIILNLRYKKRILAVEIQDYLENIYKPRLENQTFHQEDMKKYQREYFVDASEGGMDSRKKREIQEAEKQSASTELPFDIRFTKEEEAVIAEVLKEYMV